MGAAQQIYAALFNTAAVASKLVMLANPSMPLAIDNHSLLKTIEGHSLVSRLCSIILRLQINY